MKLVKFQVGGAVPEMAAEDPTMAAQGGAEMAPEAGAPEAGAEQDPMMQIIQAAMQAVQENNGELALQVCGALVQMLQQSQGAPQEGEPVYRRGGKLAYYKCGGKTVNKCEEGGSFKKNWTYSDGKTKSTDDLEVVTASKPTKKGTQTSTMWSRGKQHGVRNEKGRSTKRGYVETTKENYTNKFGENINTTTKTRTRK